MSESAEDWYRKMMAEYREDGRRDAERGRFDPPYPGASEECAPDDCEANGHYKDGFNERRRELGDKFEWR